MASFTWLVGLLVSAFLFMQVHGQTSVLRVFFTEVDFREIEGVGKIEASIIKEGPLTSDLYMNIIPLTYNEFDARGFPLDEDRRRERPEPAELDVADGRIDFNDTVQQLVIKASITSDDYTISIPITTDAINEASEGFMIVMRPDEARRNPEDVAKLTLSNNGVALGVIDDDDPIVLGFERSAYTVRESDGTVEDLVALVKQEGLVTEQIITVAVNTFDLSAEEGIDYDRIEQLAITFQPGQMRIPLPFRVIDDAIVEPTEAFGILVSRKVDTPNLVLGIDSAVVTVLDTDVLRVQFNESVYIVDEGSTVMVCVDIVGANTIIDDDVRLFFSVTSGDGTTTVEDFDIPSNIVALGNDFRQSCVVVEAPSDGIPEGTETVTLTLTPFSPLSDNVIFDTTTTLIINSNECEESTNDCFDSSLCTDTVMGFECNCPEGFTGDGRNCIDINECEVDPDVCDPSAICINTAGSFMCQCPPGFTGSGAICIDIDECQLGLDNCDIDFADCINTEGSFQCQCQEGFTGDGIECILSQPAEEDECETGSHDCSPLADCIDLDDGFECRCQPGYSGNGSICIDVNECMNGDARCYPHSTCVNLPGSYRCDCDSGYAPWGRMCMDINECRDGSNRCDVNARCTNTPGSYTCTCKDGLTGDGFSCTAEQMEEECPPGYKYRDQRCKDINECREELDECHSDAVCTNTRGNYTCTCRPGYTGNGFTCTPLQLSFPCDQLGDDGREEETTTRTKTTRTKTRSRTTNRTTPRARGRRRASWADLCEEQLSSGSSSDSTRTGTRTHSTRTSTRTHSTRTSTRTHSTRTSTRTHSTRTSTSTKTKTKKT